MEKHNELWQLFNEILPEKKKFSGHALDVFGDMILHYEEEHRQYHNVGHLKDLVNQFEEHRNKFKSKEKAVIAALLFHDVIYECQPKDDEIASAEYARIVLTELGVEEDVINTTVSIIMTTSNHKATDYETQLFLDMDMSILASDENKYDSYVNGVAYEFLSKHKGLTLEAFNEARRELFCKPTLEAGKIFKTIDYKALEVRAVKNIQREMKLG